MSQNGEVINEILSEIDVKLLHLDILCEIINNTQFYTYNGCDYFKISFIDGLNSFVIEASNSREQAEKNVLEDTDLFPLSLGKERIVKEIEEWFIKYCISA